MVRILKRVVEFAHRSLGDQSTSKPELVSIVPTLSDWNWHVLMLVQALVGVISNNFRMVTLSFDGECWIVEARLLCEDETDREEFDDAIDEFSIFLEDVRSDLSRQADKKVVGKIVVGNEPLTCPVSADKRVVFWKRET